MSAHVLDTPSTDLHHKDLQDCTVLPPDAPPDSEEDADEESANSLDVDGGSGGESDEESDDSLDVPDTVERPVEDIHPLLRPRRRPYDIDVSRLPSRPGDGN